MRNLILALFTVFVLQNTVCAEIIKFVQITDAHFKTQDEYTGEVLSKAVKDINKESDVSFVVFTGDNIDSPHPEFVPPFVKIINKLHAPYYLVLGNHDVYKNNGLSKKQYLEIVHENNPFYFKMKPNYVFKKKGFVFIVVDGAKEVIPGSIGYYKEDTLKWLDKQLTRYKRSKVIVIQHFPVVAEKEISSHRVYNKEDYLKLLDKHDNVVSVIAGHLHTNSEIMRNGVYHITSPTLLSDKPVYKVISISTTKGFSPMVYTELKEVDMKQK